MYAFDQYHNESDVKVYERHRRAVSEKKFNVIGSSTLPKWPEFLSVSSNKTELNNFLSKYIEQNSKLVGEQMIILSGGYVFR